MNWTARAPPCLHVRQGGKRRCGSGGGRMSRCDLFGLPLSLVLSEADLHEYLSLTTEGAAFFLCDPFDSRAQFRAHRNGCITLFL